MFTVCPKCTLTLAVTANDLRMGQGYVRCGRCANVFNALLTLSQEPLEEASAAAPTAADAASTSQIQAALRDDAADSATSEQSPPIGELHSHVERTDGPSLHLTTEQSSDGSIENESSFAAGTGTFETIVLEGDAITQIEEYVPEESVDSEMAALTQRLEMTARQPLLSPPNEPAPGDEPPGAEEFESPSVNRWLPRARWPWITACALLGLLLALQVINHWRDVLAASPPWNATLSRTYAAIGLPLDPHWNLAAYDIRQQGAVADPNDSQVIRVRLSLANHADRAQPLPLLRVTLLDRYGKRVASSDLTPQQYWPTGVPPREFLGHDERVDSEIAIRDPSAASASFELDVCLRARAGALHCASDAGVPP
jgi:predicted Zn finger-like uncharacterized protein